MKFFVHVYMQKPPVFDLSKYDMIDLFVVTKLFTGYCCAVKNAYKLFLLETKI